MNWVAFIGVLIGLGAAVFGPPSRLNAVCGWVVALVWFLSYVGRTKS